MSKVSKNQLELLSRFWRPQIELMVDRSSLLPRDWLLYLQPMSKQLTWAMGMVITLCEDTNTQVQIKYTNTRDWTSLLQPMIKIENSMQI